MKRLLFGAALCLTGLPFAASAADGALPLRLTGGMVFDGERFQKRDLMIDGGRFVKPSATASRLVDLSGAYVIPPLADGHTHAFDGAFGYPAQRKQFLEEGIFYALTTTAPARSVAAIRDQFGGPKNVDVVTALGGITGPESHPAEVYEALALRIYGQDQIAARQADIRASRAAADNAYYVLETAADLDVKWPLIQATSPDLIKVYLRDSQLYGQPRGDTWAGGGLDPELLPLVAERVKAAGLPLVVAASSAADVRAAATVGADILSHPPCDQPSQMTGLYNSAADSDADCTLTSADAALVAESGMTVTLIASRWADADRPQATRDYERQQVAALRQVGVPFILGSNSYGETITDGVIAKANEDLFSAAELLRMATITTAQTMFPDRRVGCLDTGCEASLLVLAGDPLADMGALKAIRWRIKEGEALTLQDIAPPE